MNIRIPNKFSYISKNLNVSDDFLKSWMIGKYDPHLHNIFQIVSVSYTIPAEGKEYMFHQDAL